MRALRRMLYAIAQPGLALIWSIIELRLLRGKSLTHRLGFDLVTDADRDKSSIQVTKLTDALLLIQRVDARRFIRMSSELRRLVVLPFSNIPGAYKTGSRTCFISDEFVCQRSAPDIAVALVHHACRSRIDRAGIRLYPDLQNRIASACARNEIAFVNRLPRTEYPFVEKWMSRRAATFTQHPRR